MRRPARRLAYLLAGVVTVLIGASVSAQEESPASLTQPVTAPALVREGNRLLLDGKPSDALAAYDEAEQLQPDAREIAFVQGLGHYELGEFDQARAAFAEAAGTYSDDLADDALYGVGTCDHAEALTSTDDPQLALSKLESAMRTYHDVLARQPEHEFARDANFKAATVWRQIKQQLEQQQQEQKECDNPQEGEEGDEQQENQQSPQSNEQDQSEEQEQQQSQQQEEGEQQEQQQASQAQEQGEDEPEKQQERVSREQAERRLREMAQAMRDRQKHRREEVQEVPVSRTEKDW